MKIVQTESNIRTIRPGDHRFMLNDGMIICPRAGFEIAMECPRNYKEIIQECVTMGWLKPVAHTYGKELTMDAMR